MVVYFIRRPSDGAIKIGYTQNLKRRSRELQYVEQMEILCVIDGGLCLETILHKRFSSIEIEGEWFHPNEELLDEIEIMSDDGLDVEELWKAAPIKVNSDISNELYFRLKNFILRNKIRGSQSELIAKAIEFYLDTEEAKA